MPLAAQVSPALEGGSAYQVGDTGTVNAGDNTGTYTVLTVDAFSRALTISVAGGTGYTNQGSVSTTATTGIGFNLNIHIIASGGALVSAIVRNPWAGYAYAPGDQGTIQGGGVGDGTAVYTVSTVDAYGQVLTLTATGGTGYWNGNVPTFQAMSTTTVTTGAGDGGLTLQYSASQTSPTPGSVYAAQVQANEGGANYQIGDGPGTITQPGPGPTAQYTVTAIDMYRSVTAVSVGGDLTGYTPRNNNNTSPGGTGGDGSLRVDLYEPTSDLGITCGSPPNGQVGQAYTNEPGFPATGGATPYSFALVDDTTLPPGLSLDNSTGIVTGTPTAQGTFPFTVQVTDTDSDTASVDCSIAVIAAALTGNVYTLNPQMYTDDDFGQINPYYVTYGHPDRDTEQQMQLGGGLKMLTYLQSLFAGVGNMNWSILCNTLANPWPLVGIYPMSQNPLRNAEWAGGQATAQRFFVKFASSPNPNGDTPSPATDNAFSLSVLVVGLKPNARMKVAGSYP